MEQENGKSNGAVAAQGSGQGAAERERTLDEIGIDGLRQLKAAELRDLATGEGLPVTSRMRKADLLKLLRAKLIGRSGNGYAPGQMLCEVCGAPARVRATRRTDDAKNVIRQVRCTGPRRHTYQVVHSA